jgi:hypothetical protein
MNRKAEFISPLVVRMLPESSDQLWQLVEPLRYYSAILRREIEVPADFVTNFVSFAPLKYTGIRAAVTHDFLYCCSNVKRITADRILLEALHSVEVPEILAHEMYIAVRAFGGGFRDSTPYTLG